MLKKMMFIGSMIVLLFAFVSPVFADGPTGNGQGQQKKGNKPDMKLTAAAKVATLKALHQANKGTNQDAETELEDQTGTADPTEALAPTGAVTPAPTGVSSNPYAKGKNFLLFGTVVSINGDLLTVQITSGNALAQRFIGQVITVQYSAATAVSLLGQLHQKEQSGGSTDIAVGDTVRVHGWYFPPAPATATPSGTVEPTTEATLTPTDATVAPTTDATSTATLVPTPTVDLGTWQARQITIRAFGSAGGTSGTPTNPEPTPAPTLAPTSTATVQ